MESQLAYLFPVTFLPAAFGQFIHGSPFISIIPLLILFHSYTVKFMSDLIGQPLPQLKFLALAVPRFGQWIESSVRRTSHASAGKIYMDTVVVVLLSYVSLLKINLSYIWLAVFPAVTLAFIAALCNQLELRGDGIVGEAATEEGDGDRTSKARSGLVLEAMAVVPYWVLCAMGQIHGGDSFGVTQFLLFLASTLGALALMAARLAQITAGGAAAAAPGLAPASELLRRAALVVLLVTAHALAAELLDEDTVVLLFLPELAPALLWLSLHVDRGSWAVTFNNAIKPHKITVLFTLGAAAAAVFAYYVAAGPVDERSLPLLKTTLVSCGASGLLVHCAALVLCQWPGQAGSVGSGSGENSVTIGSVGSGSGENSVTSATSSMGAVRLLKFWANTLLVAAAVLMVPVSQATVRLGLHEPLVATVAKGFNGCIHRMFPN